MTLSRRISESIEWPTLGLFMALYTLWLLLTWQAGDGAIWPYAVLWLTLTLHSSLQHEVIHGHPTRWQIVNSVLAAPALGLLLPYERFEDLHLKHHRNWLLTDPYDDTESYFMAQQDWQQLSSPHQQLLTLNNTLAGRLLLGPWLMYARFFNSEWRLLRTASAGVAMSWLKHLGGLLPVVLWLIWVDISFAAYLLLGVWPATALLLLRAYTEHLPEADVDERSAVVVSSRLMGLLFLNNNFHRVHHDAPGLAWYNIPARYRQHYATQPGNHIIKGYRYLLLRYAFKPRFPVAHPVLRNQPAKDASS